MRNRRQTGWTEEEIIEGIQNFYNKYNKKPVKKDFKNDNGLPTLFYAKKIMKLNSIKDIIEKSLDIEYKRTTGRKIDEDLIKKELTDLYNKLGRIPKYQEISEFCSFSETIISNYGTMKEAYEKLGIVEDYKNIKILNEIFENNKYVKDNVEFIEKFTKQSKPVLAKDMYGELLLYYKPLKNGYIPNIKSAVNRIEYMKKYIEINYPKNYFELTILGEDFNNRKNVLVQDGFGVMSCKALDLLRGRKPTIISALDKHNYFINKVKENNPKILEEIEFISRYTHSDNKIVCMNKYGLVSMLPQHILNNNNTSILSAIDKTDYFINQAKEVHGNEFDYSKSIYVNSEEKIIVTCKKHGDWLTTSANHLAGTKCPNCNNSFAEISMSKLLKSLNINFEQQKSFDGCKYKNNLFYDFYLQDYNAVIEMDGEQHFEPIEYFGGEDNFKIIKKRDKIKNNYCKENNIKLIRIPYWEFDNIEEILIKELNLDCEKEN